MHTNKHISAPNTFASRKGVKNATLPNNMQQVYANYLAAKKLDPTIGLVDFNAAELYAQIIIRHKAISKKTPQQQNRFVMPAPNAIKLLEGNYDLHARRCLTTIKIPVNAASTIMNDKVLRDCIPLYLELKPIFRNSVFFAQRKQNIYNAIAAFAWQTPRNIKRKIAHLVKLGLATWDRNRCLTLAPYSALRGVLNISRRAGRYEYLNEAGGTLKYLKLSVIKDSERNQDNAIIEKIALHKLNEAQEFTRNIQQHEKQQQLEITRIFLEDEKNSFAHSVISRTRCKNSYSMETFKKMKTHVKKCFPEYKKIYAQMYNKSVLEMKRPEERSINPEFRLSCAGIARLCGYSSAKTGTNIKRELQKYGVLNFESRYITAYTNSNMYNAAVYRPKYMANDIAGLGIFDRTWRVRRKGDNGKFSFVNKVFKRDCDSLKPLI